jgi:hypothetical protein
MSTQQIRKLNVSWQGLLPAMTKFVTDWSPPKLRSEAQYRDHLLKQLRESLPSDAKLEKEYRHRGTTLDIWLGWTGLLSTDEVAFELKLNLCRKTDYDRLVGQIEGLEPVRNKTIVVLIGNTDLSLLGRLRARYGKFTDEPLAQTMSIVCVPVANTT